MQRVCPDAQDSCYEGGPLGDAAAQENAREGVASWLRSNDVPALHATDGRRPLSYAALRSQLSIAPAKLLRGSRVAIVVGAQETAELAVLLLAIMDNGGVACPLDSKMSSEELRAAVQQLRCDVAVSTGNGGTSGKLRVLGEVPVVEVGVSPTECGAVCWPGHVPTLVRTKGIAGGSPEGGTAPADRGGDRLCLLLRTSGTTAKPKVVPLSLRNLHHGALAIAKSLQLTAADVCLNAMPFFHIGGIACNLNAVLCSGSQVICMHAFDAAEFAALLRGTPSPTWYYAVPTLHKALLLHLQGRSTSDVPDFSLRLVRSGAAHLLHGDAVALAEALGCQVLPTYSMSECMPVCSTSIGYKLQKKDTVGAPLAVSLRIVDDAGQPLPFGNQGEVLIKGPGVTAGYEGMDPVEALVGDGWFRTGDRGQFDREGDIFLCGRKREMVKRGGEQISLHEVDLAVSAHPAVQLTVSFAVRNDFWGEEVAAAVVLRSGYEADVVGDISHAAAERLADYKVPKQFLVVQESELPKTATGKFIRSGLADKLGAVSVDLGAERAARMTSVASGSSGSFAIGSGPSKAIQGIRPILAVFVMSHHIGDWESEPMKRLQNVTFNMTIFVFLSGFTMAASVNHELSVREWKDFWANRIAAIHPLYLLSGIISFLLWLVRCPPSTGDQCLIFWDSFPKGYNQFVLWSVVLMPVGYCMFNKVTWFQLSTYTLIILFPAIDRCVRRCGLLSLLLTLVLGTVCSTFLLPMTRFVQSTALNTMLLYTFVGWLPCFLCGVVAMHTFARCTANRTATSRRRWGRFTDALSALMLFVFLFAAVEARSEGDPYGRIHGYMSKRLGVWRLAHPLVTFWLYGLAIGEGSVAQLLASRWLVRLSPLAYPVYLLHTPVAMSMWYITRGTAFSRWMARAPAVPIPVTPVEIPIVVVATFALARVFNDYLATPLIPIVMRCTRWFFEYVWCCWLWRLCPKRSEELECDTLGRVQGTIRKLTGNHAQCDTPLDSVGLDSFGFAALLGALRLDFARAKELRLLTLQQLGTVRALADFLDEDNLEVKKER